MHNIAAFTVSYILVFCLCWKKKQSKTVERVKSFHYPVWGLNSSRWRLCPRHQRCHVTTNIRNYEPKAQSRDEQAMGSMSRTGERPLSQQVRTKTDHLSCQLPKQVPSLKKWVWCEERQTGFLGLRQANIGLRDFRKSKATAALTERRERASTLSFACFLDC